jgi:hypothetical protein
MAARAADGDGTSVRQRGRKPAGGDVQGRWRKEPSEYLGKCDTQELVPEAEAELERILREKKEKEMRQAKEMAIGMGM